MKETVFIPVGLQRTGTNYVTQLMTKNFQATSVQLDANQWKHGMPWEWPRRPDPNIIHIVISKNPYKWFESLGRNSADLGNMRDVHSDVVKGMVVSGPEYPITYFKYGGKRIMASINKLTALYNDFYNGWFDQAPILNLKWAYCNYELLIQNPDIFLEIMRETFDLTPLATEFSKKKWVTDFHVQQSREFTDEMRDDYVSQQPRLEWKTIQDISARLDPKVMDRLGYEIL